MLHPVVAFERRAIVLALLIFVVLGVFVAFALWGPEDPCANVIDYCDAAV